MDLSIIIVSYNTKDILYNCLQSIKNSKLQLNYEVIVVDNASLDGPLDMIERQFPDVVLIRNQSNNMYAKAANQAMKIAKGDYFFLLNSDTYIEPGNIEELYNFIDANQPEVACVGPRILNKDRSFQSEGGPHITEIKWILSTAFGVIYWPIPDHIKRYLLPIGYNRFARGECRPVGFVGGCCMLISREAKNTVGMLDEDFYFYHEEIEWCFRAYKEGFSVWVYPDSTVIHLKGASTTVSTFKRVNKDRIEQRMLFYKKTTGIFHAQILNFLKIITFFPGFLLTWLFGYKQKHKLFKLWINNASEDLLFALTKRNIPNI